MSLTTPAPALETGRWNPPGTHKRRALTAGASTLAAAATWIAVDLAPGVDLTAPTFDSTRPAAELHLGAVLAAATVAALLGWVLLAIVERVSTRPKALWTTAAIAATVVSLAGPMTGTGVDAAQRIGLVVLHLIVTAVYVPLMQRTIPTSPEAKS